MTKRETRNDDWGEPAPLGRFFSGELFGSSPSISSDGLELYLTDWHLSDGEHNQDLWMISRASVSDPWGELINLGPTVNSPADDDLPSISSDGRMLFFASERSGGLGDRDLWVARRASPDHDWGTPVNLGPRVNTTSYEIGPNISADGRTLYFQSGHNRGYPNQDIWQVSIDPIVDFNNDGIVNANDMFILIDHWHTSDPRCDIGPMPWGDGIVDIQDMIVLSEHLEPGFGRIAHWKLDETEGTVAYDSVGSDHANVHGEAAWQPDAGVLAGALEFDGVDDYVAPMCVLNPAERPFRILAWIKGGAPGQVIASQTLTEFEFGGTYLAADPTDGTLMTEAIIPKPIKSDVVITDGEWHKIGFEWDGERRHLSVDDTEVAVDGMSLPGMKNTGYLNIGTGKAFEAGTFWSGLIDDVRVYRKGGVE